MMNELLLTDKGRFRRWWDKVRREALTKVAVTLCVAALLGLGAWGYQIPGKAEDGRKAFNRLPVIERRLDSTGKEAVRIDQQQILFKNETGIKLQYISEDTKDIKEMVLFLYQSEIQKRRKAQ